MSRIVDRGAFCAGCALILASMLSVHSVAAREWVDASGKFRVEAELVAVRNGKAILEKPDGAVLSIPLDKLSAADQAFLKEQAAPAVPPAAVTTATTPAATAPSAALPAAPVTAEGAALALKAQ